MMYARTEFVLLVASFITGSQATLHVRAPPIETVITPSSIVSSTTMLSFHPLPLVTSCSSTAFSWAYSGPEDPVLLQVTNVGVVQDAPPSPITSSSTTSSMTTFSTATTRYISRSARALPFNAVDLTVILAPTYNPLAQSFVWDPVNVPQGWYMLLATIDTDSFYETSSPAFFVHTGSNMSCLGVTNIISTTNTHAPTTTPSTSSLSSLPVASIPASDLSTTSTTKVPTAVGVSVGVALLFLGLLILWFFLARKGKSRTSDGNSKNGSHRWKGFNDSKGGFVVNAPKRHRSSRSHLTSQPASIASSLGPEFEDAILGAEKSTDDHGVALSTLPVLQHQSSRSRPDRTYSASSSSSNLNDSSVGGGRSSARYSTHHSIESSPVYPPSLTFSSGNRTGAPDVLRSHSLGATGTQYSLPNFMDPSPISSSFPSPPSIASRETKQMHRQSLGKKRKPAPIYDPSEDEPISSTSAFFAIPTTSNSTELTFPELSHKSSFGPGGIEGKQLHYLIPDMPLSQPSDR